MGPPVHLANRVLTANGMDAAIAATGYRNLETLGIPLLLHSQNSQRSASSGLTGIIHGCYRCSMAINFPCRQIHRDERQDCEHQADRQK